MSFSNNIPSFWVPCDFFRNRFLRAKQPECINCTAESQKYDFLEQREKLFYLYFFKRLARGGLGDSFHHQEPLEAVCSLPVEMIHRKINLCQARGCSYSLQGLPNITEVLFESKRFHICHNINILIWKVLKMP